MEENTNLTPEQVVEKIGTMFEEKSATFSTKEELESHTNDLKEQIESLKGLEEKSSDLEKAVAKFEGKLEAFTEKAQVVPVKKLGLAESLMKAYSDNIEDIKTTIEKGGKLNLEIKDTTIGDYTGDYALTDFDSEVDRTVRNRQGILDLVSRGTTSSKFVTYVQQTATSATAWTAEGVAKQEGEPTWSEISEEVKKIASYVKVSKEMLEDLSFIRAEINNDLMEQVRVGIEDALLNGTGVGAVISGLLSAPMALPAFAPGGFATAIPDANISDLLRVVKAQIEGANFSPTHVILNPEDVAAIQLTKGSDSTYTYPMYLPMSDGDLRIAGMRVVSSNFIAAGTYLVGDMSRVNVRFRNDISMSVGLDQDDFTRNMITILAEARLVQYVKNNQKPAFVTGDIATDITAITAP